MHKAALHLGVTASAISSSLKKLQEEFGVRLLEPIPKGKPVQLTPAGQSLLKTLQRERNVLERALTQSLNIVPLDNSPIRFGSAAHYGLKFFLPYIDENASLYPLYHLYLGRSLVVMEGIRSGALDIGFVGWTKTPRGVDHHFLRHDPSGLYGARSRYAHIAKAKDLKQLRNERWIYHPKLQYDPFGYFEPGKTTFVVSDYDSYRRLMLDGRGIGVLQTDCFSDEECRQLIEAPVTNPGSDSEIYLVYRRDASERTRAVVAHIAKALTEKRPKRSR